MRQQRALELESFTGTPGTSQSLTYNIRNLPKDLKVTALVFVQEYILTNDGNAVVAGTDDIAGRVFTFIEHTSEFYKVRATGYGLDRLYHHMNGKTHRGSGGWAGSGVARTLRIPTVLPLSDARAEVPHESAVPTELINGTSIQVVTGALALTAATMFGAAAAGSVSYRLFAQFTEGSGPVDPVATRIDFEDWGGQTALLKPGAYTHVLSYKEDGTATTPAELDRITFTIDGDPVLQNIQAWQQVLEFNRNHVSGGFVDAETEQLPTAVAGYPFLPWYTPPAFYKLAGVPQTEGPNVTAQFTGTATTQRFLYRQAMFKNASMIQSAAQKFGKGEGTVRALKTASKTDVAGGSNAPRDIEKRSRLSKLISGRLT